MKRFTIFGFLLTAIIGCTSNSELPSNVDLSSQLDSEVVEVASSELPVFGLATSEYPSWSTYVVAAKAGLINPEKGGEHGTFESKYGVDVVLEVKDYDPCIVAYGQGNVDAVCITNIDILNTSMSRDSTIIMPTSTSAGGDQGIAVGIDDLAGLKGIKVYGLDNSVSEYTHYRNIEVAGLNPADFPFENLDPGPAATALQSSSTEIKAICVWNPFALQTLNNNPDAKVIYSSEPIKGEIIDSVVVANEALKRAGGEAFATCLCAIQYEVNNRIANPDSSDVTISALKDDFAPGLSLLDMKDKVLKQTQFYSTPSDGVDVFGPNLKTTMATVIKTCQAIGILQPGQEPTISYDGSDGKQLTFATKYMELSSK